MERPYQRIFRSFQHEHVRRTILVLKDSNFSMILLYFFIPSLIIVTYYLLFYYLNKFHPTLLAILTGGNIKKIHRK